MGNMLRAAIALLLAPECFRRLGQNEARPSYTAASQLARNCTPIPQVDLCAQFALSLPLVLFKVC